jgi:DNA-binding transcriptional LysR family regulator
VQQPMSSMGQKRTSSRGQALVWFGQFRSETIDAAAHRGFVEPFTIHLLRFAGETFIVYGRPRKPGQHGLGQYEAMIAACHAAGFSPRIGQEAPRISSTLNLVAVGLGISLVPASLSRMNMDGVVYRRLKGNMQPKAILNLASRRGDPSVVVRHFLNLVKKAAKDFAEG